MQNNNEINKEQKPDFMLELLRAFYGSELKRIEEAKIFFSEAFLIHTSEEVFDDSEYRQQWAVLINWMNDICEVTKTVSQDEIEDILKEEIAKRLEVSHA